MVEKHNGVWGGCWDTWFHMTPKLRKQWSGKHQEYKEKLVRANQSHSALVYDGADVVGCASSDLYPNFPVGCLVMARWTSICPTGELHASSSTATTGARELRKLH